MEFREFPELGFHNFLKESKGVRNFEFWDSKQMMGLFKKMEDDFGGFIGVFLINNEFEN